MTLHEVNAAADSVYEVVDQEANIIFGAVIDDSMDGEIRITVIATGFTGDSEEDEIPGMADVPPVFADSARHNQTSRNPGIRITERREESIPEPRRDANRIEIPDFLQRRRFPKS